MVSSFFSHSRRLTTNAATTATRALKSTNPNSTSPHFSRNTAGSVFQQVTPDYTDLLPSRNLARFCSLFPAAAWATSGTIDSKLRPVSNWGLSGSRPVPSKPHLLTLPSAGLPVLVRSFSSTTEPPGPSGTPREQEFKHQEIEGPTVEPDNSALANETRQVLEALQKSVYDLSSVLAILAAVHLAVGAWVATQGPDRLAAAQGVAAFAFPFVAAFLMRRTLKPLGFFTRMEQQGRLQVLTLALQAAKHIRLLFLRVRVLAMCCAAGVSVGSVSALWFH